MKEDGSLLSRIKAGDNAAFETLLKAEDVRLYSIALKITGDRAADEDAVYDTYEQLIRNVDRIRDPDALVSWLISAVKNRAIDYLRKNSRTVPLDAAPESAAHSDTDPAEAADVARCMAALSESQAKVLLMYAEGFKLREIAAFNGISVTSAWSLLKKAKKNFIKLFDRD